MKKAVIILALIIVLFTSQQCEAVTIFEKFLLENPKLFRLITIGVCVLMGLIIVAYNYLLTRQEIAKIVETMSHEKDKTKEIEKEATQRLKKYRKIPRGDIGDISLPPAALVALGSVEKEYELTPKMQVTIGRSFDNLVIVDRSSTSRHHAMIRPQKEGYVLYDLLSRGGTFVNTKKVTSHVLQDGDIISTGKENFLFKFS